MESDFFRPIDSPGAEDDPERPPKTYVSGPDLTWHGVAFLGLIAFAIAAFAFSVAYLDGPHTRSETSLLIAVVATAALGGLLHATTSFVTFAGNRQLLHSWVPWLHLRAPLGVALGLLVYAAFRAGIFGDGEVAEAKDFFTLSFATGLAGMFSKQVADKLGDLVDKIFVTSTPVERKDALHEEGADGATAASAAAPAFDETIQRVQRRLIELGHLASPDAQGMATDDGILDDETRGAIAAFLQAIEITDADREATLGPEAGPDYWSGLLDLLDHEAERRQASP